jgi:Na+/proline symporter
MKTISSFLPRNTQTSGHLVIFGIFMLLLGAIGYVTHPEKAHTALILGGGFGALWMLWGILSVKGARWSWSAALTTTALLLLACMWRAGLSWLAVANGQSEKAFASVVFTLILAVSAFILFSLLKDRKRGGSEKPAGEAQ